MENSQIATVFTNIGFASVFALTLIEHTSIISIKQDLLIKIYLGSTLAAAVMSFLLMLVMVREFRKPSDRSREHYYRKKADAFMIFGLLFSLASSVSFGLTLINYPVPKDIIPILFLLAIVYLSVSRYYQHAARRTRSFTSIGSVFTFFQIFGAIFLLNQPITRLISSLHYKATIDFSLFSAAMFFAVALVIKDIFKCRCERGDYPLIIKQDLPETFPYEISPMFMQQILFEHSIENILFFKKANKFYYTYVKNRGNLTSQLKKAIKNIYEIFIVPGELQKIKKAIDDLHISNFVDQEEKYSQTQNLEELVNAFEEIYRNFVLVNPLNNENVTDNTEVDKLKRKISNIYETFIEHHLIDDEQTRYDQIDMRALIAAIAELEINIAEDREINLDFRIRSQAGKVYSKFKRIEDMQRNDDGGILSAQTDNNVEIKQEDDELVIQSDDELGNTQKSKLIIRSNDNLDMNEKNNLDIQTDKLIKNFKAVYSHMCSLMMDPYKRYSDAMQKYTGYTLLLLPGLGLLMGGSIGYGIQYFIENKLLIIAGAMTFWLIGYAIGECVMYKMYKNKIFRDKVDNVIDKLTCCSSPN